MSNSKGEQVTVFLTQLKRKAKGFEAYRESLIAASSTIHAYNNSAEDDFENLAGSSFDNEWVNKHLEESARSLIHFVLSFGLKYHSPTDTPLSTSYKYWYSTHLDSNNNYNSFNMMGVWNDVVGKYGEEKGAGLIYKDVAKSITNIFRDIESPKIIKGKVSLCVNYSANDRFNGGKTLDGYASTFNCLYKALKDIAMWVDDQDHATGFHSLSEATSWYTEVSSREKIDISESSYVITYFNKFDFRFDKEFFQKINLFVAKYSS